MILDDSQAPAFPFKGSELLLRFHVGPSELCEDDDAEIDEQAVVRSQMTWGCPSLTSVLNCIQGTSQPAEVVGRCCGRESRRLGSGLTSTTVCLCSSHEVIQHVFHVCRGLGSVPLGTQAAVALRGGWREALAFSEWPSASHPQATSG